VNRESARAVTTCIFGADRRTHEKAGDLRFGAIGQRVGAGLPFEAHHHYQNYYYAPRPVYVVPAPRYVYAPPPPVVYPYYAAPAAVIAAPIMPGVSIRLRLPL